MSKELFVFAGGNAQILLNSVFTQQNNAKSFSSVGYSSCYFHFEVSNSLTFMISSVPSGCWNTVTKEGGMKYLGKQKSKGGVQKHNIYLDRVLAYLLTYILMPGSKVLQITKTKCKLHFYRI